MLAADVGTGEVLISMIGFFLFLLWFVLLFYVFADIIRSHDLSGWGKAIWTFVIIFLPYLGIFAYLVIRGHGMAARQAGGQVRIVSLRRRHRRFATTAPTNSSSSRSCTTAASSTTPTTPRRRPRVLG